jgi:hypothetical protein
MVGCTSHARHCLPPSASHHAEPANKGGIPRANNKGTLRFALSVIRHGARQPLSKPWTGCLTEEGMQMTKALGSFVRTRYGTLVAEPENVFVRSTNSERTIQTAKCQLEGMFPEIGESARPHIHVGRAEVDVFKPHSNTEWGAVQKLRSKEMEHALKSEIDSVISEVNNHMGFDKDNEVPYTRHDLRLLSGTFICAKASRIFDTVQIQPASTSGKNNKIPTVRLEETMNRLLESEEGRLIGKQLVRLHSRISVTKSDTVHAGSKFASLLSSMLSVKAGQVDGMDGATYSATARHSDVILPTADDLENTKFVLIAAHDSTIISLLRYFGDEVAKLPPFAASLTFELWERDDHVHSTAQNAHDPHASTKQQNHCRDAHGSSSATTTTGPHHSHEAPTTTTRGEFYVRVVYYQKAIHAKKGSKQRVIRIPLSAGESEDDCDFCPLHAFGTFVNDRILSVVKSSSSSSNSSESDAPDTSTLSSETGEEPSTCTDVNGRDDGVQAS